MVEIAIVENVQFMHDPLHNFNPAHMNITNLYCAEYVIHIYSFTEKKTDEKKLLGRSVDPFASTTINKMNKMKLKKSAPLEICTR